ADAPRAVGVAVPGNGPAGPDGGGYVAHQFLADALDHDGVGLGHLQLDALGGRHFHRVGKAEAEAQLLALQGRPVPHAFQHQGAAEPFGHPGHHVGDEAAGQPVHGAGLRAVVLALQLDGVALHRHGQGGVHLAAQLALGALHPDFLAGRLNLDTGGYGNGILAHSRHASDLLPNVADDSAADAFLAGLAVAHQAPRGGKYGDAQAPQHAGNLILLGIIPQAGAAYPAQTGDDPLLAGPVLQVQPEHALLVIIDPLEVVNEALFLQNL